jgi:EF-hand domain pair
MGVLQGGSTTED